MEAQQTTHLSSVISPAGGKAGAYLIAGGGTGGHIFPAIAIANAIRALQPSARILFVGAKGKMEMEKVPQAGYAIEAIDMAGFNRSSLFRNISLPFKLIRSFFQVRKIIRSFRPDAAIGVGGYSTYPVLRYAQSKGIPTFIHESNSHAGKSNILLGRKATRIFVASEGMEKFFPAGKIVITGNPVRQSIVNTHISREEALQAFGLSSGKKTVLVVGGSLGARSINEAIAAHIAEFADHGLQLIWQTGKATAAQFEAVAKGHSNVWCGAFINRMETAYAAADVVISRAGAMAIAELSVVKKPVVFVPYPFAAEDHQTANAAYLAGKQAATMIRDNEVKQQLVDTVFKLAADEVLQQQYSTNIGRLATSNADIVVANTILKLTGANNAL
jgi:UDP-N-acetylglucosamine--N-acetylmuramyl-(pentapeptide) pyrophosphoryl-undecaprenol N-acetylglucosamine transferase